jgi:hypothetical protein
MGIVQVVFACVAENGPGWFDRVHSLVLSIRTFGGSLREAPVLACFVEGVDDRFAGPLRDLGAEVRVVPRLDPRYPYANKLRMLEHASEDEVLIALDCDVVVLGDVTAYPDPVSVLAKPADCDFLTPEQWATLFDALHLEAPARTVTTTTFGQRTHPYFNSGVLLIPGADAPRLRDAWERYVYALQELYERLPDLARHRFYTDQLALACALVSEEIAVRSLPVRMNLPTHLNVHPAFLAEAFPPLIVHYHKRVSHDGFILPTRYAAANTALDRFNRARADALGLPYAGLPRFALPDRMKQELRSRSWFHAEGIKSVRRAVRRLVPGPGR